MYIIYYILIYPFLLILSFFRKKTDKILIIQTAKIGDYVNTSAVFDLAKKFDIVLDKVNLDFANYDDRIEKKFVINSYKKGIKKLFLGLKIFLNSYYKIYVFMPNNLNLFLAKLGFAKEVYAISHYKNSSLFKVLSFGCDVINHTKNDLTLLTYLKMFGTNELKFKKKIQHPIFIPKNPIINSNKFKVGISLSARNKIKTIPFQTWNKVFKILSKFDLEIYIFGLEDEMEFLKYINVDRSNIFVLLGKIQLHELPFYISLMNLYISSDTGNYYIADSMEVATICFMGPCFFTEQRGIFDSLIITPPLEPFTSVFDTIYNKNCKEYFYINKKDEINIENFITKQYNLKYL